MPLYFITGATGSGKSTLRDALIERGYEAHDTDGKDLASFYNNITNEPIDRPTKIEERTKEWYANHSWKLSRSGVEKLANQAKTKPVFLCGIASNNDEMNDLFAKVFCLTLDQETLKQRIFTRTNNDFGKASDELASILGWHTYFEDKNRQAGASMLDASQPVDKIVNVILKETHQPLQSLLLDFSYVLLHPKDRTYQGKLNDLNKQLTGDDPLKPYPFDEYFIINQDLLEKIKAIKTEHSLTICMFTTDIIQERPEVKAKISGVFDRIFTARELVEHGISQQNFDATKADHNSYTYIAKQLNLDPQAILYIDDKQQNLDAAKAAGLRTLLYPRLKTIEESNAQLFENLTKNLT